MDIKARRTFSLSPKRILNRGEEATVSDELGGRLIARGDAELAPAKTSAKAKPAGKARPAAGKAKPSSSSPLAPASAPSTLAQPETAPAS